MSPLAPFNLFPEEMFLRFAVTVIGLGAVTVAALVWFCVAQLSRWSSMREIKRLLEKEDALRSTSATRIWHESRG